MARKVSGQLMFAVDGVRYLARGNFEYSLGGWKKSPVVGSDGMHGYSEEPIPSYIQGDITDTQETSMAAVHNIDGKTALLKLANGKSILLRDTYDASDQMVNAQEGRSQVRLESSKPGEEI